MAESPHPERLGIFNHEDLKIVLTSQIIDYYRFFQIPNIDDAKGWSKVPLTLPIIAVSHEISHWYQDIGTPLGMARHLFHEAPVKIIRNLCPIISQQQLPNRKIRLPLSQTLKNIDKSSVSGYLFVAAASYTILREIIDGRIIVDCTEAIELLIILSHDFECRDSSIQYWEAMLNRANMKSNNDEGSSPYSKSGEVIGAIAIQEGQATAINDMEIILAENNGRPIRDDLTVQDPNRWNGIYNIALDHLKDIMGWEKDLSKLQKTDIFFKLYTFSALCDLAMASPLSPVFHRSWRPGYSWKDFHPGWRFHCLCLTMKSLDIELTSVNKDDYVNFILKLTERLNWDQPIDVYATKIIYPNSWVLEKIAERASDIRAECPNVFINPFMVNSNNHKYVAQLQQGLPPPYIGISDPGSNLMGSVKPPLKVRGFEITTCKELEELIAINRYAAKLAYHIIWTGLLPKSVPQLLKQYNPIEYVTGLSEMCFEWNGTI